MPRSLDILFVTCALGLGGVGCSFEPPAMEVPASADMPRERAGQEMGPGRDQGPALDAGPRDMSVGPALDAGPEPDDGGGAEDLGPPTPADAGRDLSAPDLGPALDAGPPEEMGQEDMDPGPRVVICEGDRTDVSSDPNHCGQCGSRCDADWAQCDRGRCVCSSPLLTHCNPEAACVDLQVDPNHCGRCGFECGAGAACQGGQCVCRPGLTECDGECVDTASDPRHCGGCGISCGGDACKERQCRGGSGCGFGWIECGWTGANACLDVGDGLTHDLHCRSLLDPVCGDRCAGDELCIKPSTLEERKCRGYRPGRGCTACPCADCGQGERCREAIGVADRVYCVEVD